MTIYELEKTATPGPLTRQGCTVLAKTGWVMDRDPWTLGASEEFHVLSTDENHRAHDEQEANAAHIVHCVNHFMEALAELKRIARTADCHGPGCYFCECDSPHPTLGQVLEIDAIIAKLETVEGIRA